MTARVRLGALAITVAAITAVPAAAQGAEYGSRTMREGTNGSDVKQLQRYLTQAGFDTTADGAFGPITARSVRRFERADGRPVNGVVPPRDARAIEAQASEATPDVPEPTEPPETGRARITSDGLAVAPADAPEEVKQVIAAGNEIAKKPYKYGGGHGDWNDSGYDCSGSVSYALHGAGLVSRAARLRRVHELGGLGTRRLDHGLRPRRPRLHDGRRHPLRHERARRGRHPLARHEGLHERVHNPPPERSLKGQTPLEAHNPWKPGVLRNAAATLRRCS